MKSRSLAALAAVTLLAIGVSPVSADDRSCEPAFAGQALTGQFEGTVREGPDEGLSVSGELTMNVDASGHFTGTLIEPDSSTHPFTGQFSGRAVHYRFELGPEPIFGTGVLP